MKRYARFAASLVIVGAILTFVGRYIDFGAAGDVLGQLQRNLVVIGIALMIGGYLARAARWRIWEPHLGYSDAFKLVLVRFMGNNVLPVRLRERWWAGPAAFASGNAGAAELAPAALESALDGLVLCVFGMFAVACVSLARPFQFALLGVAGASITFGLTVCLPTGPLKSYIAAVKSRFPFALSDSAPERLAELVDRVEALWSGLRGFSALLLTVLIFISEAGSCYFVGRAVWQGMGLRIAVLFCTVVNFASLTPFTFGGVGAIEVVGPLFLISAGIIPQVALAVTLLLHGSQYLFTTIRGGLLFLTGGLRSTPVGDQKSLIVNGTGLGGAAPVIEETRSKLGALGALVQLKPAQRSDIELSIVIPAFNEQSRLPKTLLETLRWCTRRAQGFELIIADDGSRDATRALCRLFEESDTRIRTITCPHMGKGAAVRMGVLNSRGRFVLFMDADGATPLSEIPKLLAAVQHGHDVAIGSRVIQRPGEVHVKTSFHRRLIGRTFSFFVNLLATEGIADTQCGFKMFRREAAVEIFCRQKIAGFAFDVEILYIARQLAMSIAEVPVNWTAQPGSKVNLVVDSVKMLWDIGHIRLLHRNFDRNCIELSQSVKANGSRLGKAVFKAGKGCQEC